MDTKSLETVLDIVIIVIALAALGVAIFMALRLMKKSSPAEPAASAAKPAAAPKPATTSPAKSSPAPKSEAPKPPKSTGKTIFDQVSTTPQQPKSFSKPVFDQISESAKEIANSQGFVAEQLRLESASRLVLSLKNTGAKVIFKRVSPGPNNEVTVTHVQEAQPTNSLLPEYPKDSSIFFHLDADNVIGRTFQFTLYYGDLQGNLYRQDVSGLGKEYPIIDPVVKIA